MSDRGGSGDRTDRDDQTASERGEPTTAEREEPTAERQQEVSERSEERSERTTEVASGGGEPPDDHGRSDGGGLAGGAAIAVAAVVALAVTALSYLWASGRVGGVEIFYENLFRVAPTVSGGGVGTDWVVGNTVPWLDAAIAIVHAADVLMGVFILGMVFIHWAIFRRLSTRMRPPAGAETGGAVATDGGARGDAASGDDATGGGRERGRDERHRATGDDGEGGDRR